MMKNTDPAFLNSSGGGVVTALDSNYWRGAGSRGGKEREFVVSYFDQQRIGQYGQGRSASTLMARDYKSEKDLVVNKERHYVVRRLTPLECCRLQGFPDWWEDGVEGSDSNRYKMWGNGIALPCAFDVLRRISEEAGNVQD